ncbi:MAG: tol-pal system protein YbgF [Alphaproteobacteria bacterium]|nr:MAG: tol-pal system protein YbgF [Alphaproteobacteria bacterium]
MKTMSNGSQGARTNPVDSGASRWRDRLRLAGVPVLLVLVLLAAAMIPERAFAAPSRAELAQQLNELKSELATLSQEMKDLKARLDMPEGATDLLRRMVVRVDSIEHSLAVLTGRIEELDHRQRETAARLEKFAADTRARLSALELSRPPTATGTTAGDSAATAVKDAADQMHAPPPAAISIGAKPPAGGKETSPPLSAGSAAQPEGSVPTPAAGTPATTAPASVGDPKTAYDAAFALLRQGRFGEAETAFADFLARFPDHPLAANAQYWLGETFYVRKDYARAAEAFLKGYEEHRDRPKAADSLLKLGMSLGALGKREEACATFDELERGFEDLDPRIRQRLKAERARFSCR